MTDRTCMSDGCDTAIHPTRNKSGLCKPCSRRDYYRRNKERENASNKAYREARPEYWKQRWADYSERRWGAERAARAEALAAKLAASHKECTRCGNYVPKVEFYQHPGNKDRRHSWCIACFTAHCRANYDPQKEAVKSAEYWSRPDSLEKAKASARRRYLMDPERVRRQWSEKSGRRRARILETTREPVDYSAILAEYGMVCHICAVEIPGVQDLHFDHVIPLSKGGAHAMDNIRPSHARCNLSKGAKLLP